MSYYAYGNGDIEYRSPLNTDSSVFKDMMQKFKDARIEVERTESCISLHDDGNYLEEHLDEALSLACEVGDIKESYIVYKDEYGESWCYAYSEDTRSFTYETGEVYFRPLGAPDPEELKNMLKLCLEYLLNDCDDVSFVAGAGITQKDLESLGVQLSPDMIEEMNLSGSSGN